MKKLLLSLILVVAALTTMGCFFGRTSVVATSYNSEPYDVYLNGKHLCTISSDDDCTVKTRGTTGGGLFEAKQNGKVVGSVEAHRKFTALSFLYAPFTYLTSIWLYKAYTEDIEIEIDQSALNSVRYSKNNRSVWDDDPYNYSRREESNQNEDVHQEEKKQDESPTKTQSVWD